MKHLLHLGTLALLAGPLLAADSAPDQVKSAAKALAGKPNYSWKTSVESAGGQGGRRGGPTEGKTEQDGYTLIVMTRGDNTTEAAFKGTKSAVKGEDGWKSSAELTEGDDGRARFMVRMLQNFKTPAAQAEELASKTKELKKADDAYAGDLTEAAAKELLTFGPARGGDGPAVENAKASVKFWVKDGVLTKFEYKVQGKVSFQGNDRDVDRTSTVEIKDVGTTKVAVPEEAKKKLS